MLQEQSNLLKLRSKHKVAQATVQDGLHQQTRQVPQALKHWGNEITAKCECTRRIV